MIKIIQIIAILLKQPNFYMEVIVNYMINLIKKEEIKVKTEMLLKEKFYQMIQQ